MKILPEEKGIATEESKASQNKHNSGGSNRQKNANRGNDRGGKNNRSKRQISNNKRNGSVKFTLAEKGSGK